MPIIVRSGTATTANWWDDDWWSAMEAAPEGTVVTVAAGANLQTAIDAAAAAGGPRTLKLAAGATFTGDYVLPLNPSEQYIMITSDAGFGLPAVGARVTPSHLSALPLLKATVGGQLPAIRCVAGANHWRLQCLALEQTQASGLEVVALRYPDGTSPVSYASCPHHIELDRVLIDVPDSQEVRRGVTLTSAYVDIHDCHIAGVKVQNADNQAASGEGPGPFRLDNNFLEASCENIMFGGFGTPYSGCIPSDIVITRNHLSKRLTWHPLADGSAPFNGLTYGGTLYSVKNLIELKQGQRVLIEGNLFEYCWCGSQDGACFVFTPRNQDNVSPWAVVRDVTVRNNLVRHVGYGAGVSGHDSGWHSPSEIMPDPWSAQTVNVAFRNNLFYDIHDVPWGYGGSNGKFLKSSDLPTGLVLEHNTVQAWSALAYLDCVGGGTDIPAALLVGNIFRDNLCASDPNGVFMRAWDTYAAGDATIAVFFTNGGGVCASNVIGLDNADEPTHYATHPQTFVSLAAFYAAFVDYAGGNWRLTPGHPYWTAATDGTQLGCDVDAVLAAMSADTRAAV